MILSNRTVLITGGATGIGFALAKRFMAVRSKVIVCGRRADRLNAARHELPGLITIRSDVSSESERLQLFEQVASDHPDIDILTNNAGIQNRPPSVMTEQDFATYRQELAINFEAPVHLSLLFAKHFINKPNAAIINISSGLAFSPLAFMPMYCATKAALHSFTLSLRHQLRDTSVRVVEVIPPKVQTDLGGVGLHDDGVPLDTFADHAWHQLASGSQEFGFEFSERNRLSSREALDQIFEKLNPR